MGIRGVSAIIINIIKTYWNPWICLIFIFTSWEIPMQPFCWRIVLIQKVFRICRTCQGNYIRRCLWRYTGNYRRLSGRTGTIYWRSYSKREERSVLWLFRNDWNRLNSGGIFQRSMMKNRIVVIEKLYLSFYHLVMVIIVLLMISKKYLRLLRKQCQV